MTVAAVATPALAEERAAGDTAGVDTFGVLGANLAQGLERHAACACDPGITEQTAKGTQQRSSSHRDPPHSRR